MQDIINTRNKNKIMDEWIDIYEDNPGLQENGTLYLYMIILQNVITNESFQYNTNFKPVPFFTCLKIGSSYNTTYNRIKNSFREYDAIWCIPLLVIKANNISNIESLIHRELFLHKLKIACSADTFYKIAREFYVIDVQVIDTFIDIINKEDPEYELILDNIDDEYIDYFDYIPETLIKSIYGQKIEILLSQDSYEDSLTDLQKQHIKKYYKEDDLKEPSFKSSFCVYTI